MLHTFTVRAVYSTYTIFIARISPISFYPLRANHDSSQGKCWSSSIFVFLLKSHLIMRVFARSRVCGIANLELLVQAAGVWSPVLDELSRVCVRRVTLLSLKLSLGLCSPTFQKSLGLDSVWPA